MKNFVIIKCFRINDIIDNNLNDENLPLVYIFFRVSGHYAQGHYAHGHYAQGHYAQT